ncbi:unnamed protein product [Symbiodinium sp. KB8]|nr:unnamed protein product [Symbiodinium sp. KB8]
MVEASSGVEVCSFAGPAAGQLGASVAVRQDPSGELLVAVGAPGVSAAVLFKVDLQRAGTPQAPAPAIGSADATHAMPWCRVVAVLRPHAIKTATLEGVPSGPASGVGHAVAFMDSDSGPLLLAGAPHASTWAESATSTGAVYAATWCTPGTSKAHDRSGALPFKCKACPAAVTASHGGADPTCMDCTDRVCTDAGTTVFSGQWGDLPLELGADYQVDIKAISLTGASTMSVSHIFRVDWTPPAAGQVADGLSLDSTEDSESCGDLCDDEIAFTMDNSSAVVSWVGFQDDESSIADYLVSVLVNGVERVPWRSVGTRRNTTISGLDLQQGDHIVSCVLAVNGAGLPSNSSCSDGFFVDRTAPVMLWVKDGLSGPDLGQQSLTDIFTNNWEAAVDVEGEVTDFEWAIATHDVADTAFALEATLLEGQWLHPNSSMLPVPDLLQWELIGPQTFGSVVRRPLLQNVSAGTPVFTWVRAHNQVGLVSGVASSDGLIVGKSDAKAQPDEETVMGFDTAPSTDYEGQEEAPVPSTTMGSVQLPPGAAGEGQRFTAGSTKGDDDPSLVDGDATPPPADNFKFGEYSFSLRALDDDGEPVEGYRFAKPILVGEDLEAQQASVPKLFFWSAATEQWMNAVDTCTGEDRYEEVFPALNQYSVHVCHLTQFGVFQQLRPQAAVTVTAASNATVVSAMDPAGAGAVVVDAALAAGHTAFTTNAKDFNSSFLVYTWNEGQAGTITLDGSSSVDPDGTITQRSWTVQGIGLDGDLTLGDAVPLQVVGDGQTAVVGPVITPGVYYVTHRVVDDFDAWSTRSVILRVNAKPTAGASIEQPVVQWPSETSSEVTAGSSTDPERQGLTFVWQVLRSPPPISGVVCRALLLQPESVRTVVRATCAGEYTLGVTATDEHGASHSTSLQWFVNDQPLARLQSAPLVRGQQSVNVSAARSSDSHAIAGYEWSAAYKIPISIHPSLVASVRALGIADLEWGVADDTFALVPVLGSGVWQEHAGVPAVQAVADSLLRGGFTARLGPAVGHTVTVVGLNATSSVVVRVSVRDVLGGVGVAERLLTFNLPPQARVEADALDVLLWSGAQAVLRGSSSFDPDGTLLSSAWRVVSAPPSQLTLPEVTSALLQMPTALNTPLQSNASLPVGTYVVQLTVTDDSGEVAATTASIRVLANVPAVSGRQTLPWDLQRGWRGSAQMDLPALGAVLSASVRLVSAAVSCEITEAVAAAWPHAPDACLSVDVTPPMPQPRVAAGTGTVSFPPLQLNSVPGPGVYTLKATLVALVSPRALLLGVVGTASQSSTRVLLSTRLRITVDAPPKVNVTGLGDGAGSLVLGPLGYSAQLPLGGTLALSGRDSRDFEDAQPRPELVWSAPPDASAAVGLPGSRHGVLAVSGARLGRSVFVLTATDAHGHTSNVSVQVEVVPPSSEATDGAGQVRDEAAAQGGQYAGLSLVVLVLFVAVLGMVVVVWRSGRARSQQYAAGGQPDPSQAHGESGSALLLVSSGGSDEAADPPAVSVPVGDEPGRARPPADSPVAGVSAPIAQVASSPEADGTGKVAEAVEASGTPALPADSPDSSPPTADSAIAPATAAGATSASKASLPEAAARDGASSDSDSSCWETHSGDELGEDSGLLTPPARKSA